MIKRHQNFLMNGVTFSVYVLNKMFARLNTETRTEYSLTR